MYSQDLLDLPVRKKMSLFKCSAEYAQDEATVMSASARRIEVGIEIILGWRLSNKKSRMTG